MTSAPLPPRRGLDAPVGPATRVVLLAVLVLSFTEVAHAGLVESGVVTVACLLVVAAQVLSLLPPVGRLLDRYPVGLLGVAVVAVSMPLTSPALLLTAAALLGLGWETVQRALAPLFSSLFLLLIASTRVPIDGQRGLLLAWGTGIALALGLLGADQRRALPLLAGPRVGRPRVALRAVAEIGAVTVLLVAATPPLVAAVTRRAEPAAVRRGAATPGGPTYWGFEGRLDTAVRRPLGDEIVLRVRSATGELWRATSYDRWDGRTWTRAPSSPTLLRQEVFVAPPGIGDDPRGPDPGGAASSDAASDVPVVELNQTVTVDAPGTATVFGAGRVAVVDAPTDRLWWYDDGTLEPRQAFGRGTVYNVTSWRPVVTSSALRAADARRSVVPGSLATRYLDTTALSARARAVGRSITAGAPSTLDAVRAMETWLAGNVAYSRDIPALPSGEDAVDRFLFTDRAGYCEQIATTMALWVRDLGVPARVAVGFAPGAYSVLSDEWIVRERDAHAWVEVWFPGIGWQAFDPTAAVPLSGERPPDDRDAGPDILRAAAVPALGLLVGLLAVVAVLAVRDRRDARPARSGPQGRAERLARALERGGARRGRPRRRDETLQEYAQALVGSVWPDPRLVTAAAAIGSVLFGGADDAVVRTAATDLTAARRAHPPRRSRRSRR